MPPDPLEHCALYMHRQLHATHKLPLYNYAPPSSICLVRHSGNCSTDLPKVFTGDLQVYQCNKTHKVTWKSAGAHAVVCACVIKVWLTLTDENALASNIASLLWSKWRNYARGVNWNGCKDVNPGRTLAFVSIEMTSSCPLKASLLEVARLTSFFYNSVYY